ncbi:MAG: hypothetical protein ACI9AR_000291 [Flavobacteriaceae bacterium]|jgi:hypothetical protein
MIYQKMRNLIYKQIFVVEVEQRKIPNAFYRTKIYDIIILIWKNMKIIK